MSDDPARHHRIRARLADQLAEHAPTLAQQLATHPHRREILHQAATTIAQTIDAGHTSYTGPADPPDTDDVLLTDADDHEQIEVSLLARDPTYWQLAMSTFTESRQP